MSCALRLCLRRKIFFSFYTKKEGDDKKKKKKKKLRIRQGQFYTECSFMTRKANVSVFQNLSTTRLQIVAYYKQ